MTVKVKFKPRVSPIPFEIEMTIEDLREMKTEGFVNLIQSVEWYIKTCMDRLYKEEVKRGKE